MPNLAEQAEPAITNLLNASDDALFQTLGIRARAMQTNPGLSSDFAAPATHDASMMGPLDEVKKYGERIFQRPTAARSGTTFT